MSGAAPGLFGRRRVRPRAMTTDDLIFVLVGTVLAMLLGLTLLFWGAAKISGRLNSGHWPNLSFIDMAPIVVNAIQNPSDPASAFPAPASTQIPGPVEFYGIMLVLFLIPAGLIIALLLAMFREGPLVPWAGRGLFWRQRRGQNWARMRDIKPLVVEHPQPGRLTLGRVYGRLVAAEPGQSVIVLGPSGSMKTAGFAIPSILEWQGPVVATSMTSELILDTLDRRRELGDVHVYDPTASTALPRSGWTPLANAKEWAEALRTASSLASAAMESAAVRKRDQDLWLPDASSLIAPLLYAAATSGRVMSDVVRWVQRREKDQVQAALEAAGEPAAADAIEGVWRLDERQQSELYHTAQIILSAYADPLVAESARISQLSADALLDGGFHTAYLTAPAHELARLRPLFAALLHEVVTAAYERVSETGRPLDPPLLLVLDGAADVGAVQALDVYASTAAAHGIQLVSIFQDLSEIRSRYGERADTIMNNHRARVIMSGTSGTETIEYLANLLGDEEIQQVMQTYGEDGFSSSEMSGYRRVTPADVLREIQPGEGLLVYGFLPPAELTLRPWFRDHRLRELAGDRRLERPPTAKQRVRRLGRFGQGRRRRPAPEAAQQATGTRQPLRQPPRQSPRQHAAQPGQRPRIGGGIVLPPRPDEEPGGDTSIDLSQPTALGPSAQRDADPPTQELPRVPRDASREASHDASRDGSGEAR